MDNIDLSDIPIPPPPSSDQAASSSTNPTAEDLQQYWQRAQSNLQQIAPAAPSLGYGSFSGSFYPTPDMYNLQIGFNPAGHMFPSSGDVLSAQNRLRAEQRLRDVLPRGAPITPFRQMAPRPNVNFRPRQTFQLRVMAPSNVSVKATEGNFVFSDLFSRMIPESVNVFIEKCYDTLPSDKMRSQLEFYLKERITPMLDSGVAARINWDAEPMPHKINFQVQTNWTPAAKIRGTVGTEGNRKRAFENDNGPLNGIPNPLVSKREKKRQVKASENQAKNGAAPMNEKMQRYLNKGIGFIKTGETAEDGQRRLKRAMRFNDGGDSSVNVGNTQKGIESVILNEQEPFVIHRQRKRQVNKADEDLSYFDRRQTEQDLMKLTGTFCPKAADKYQILLKRDGFMSILAKLKSKSRFSKDLAAKRVGTCEDMCPETERYMRQVGNLLHPFECNPDGTLNHKLAVKDYSRSAADQDEPLPHELRSPAALKKTMDYLILMCKRPMPESELVLWYDFLWSRTRAIRKEITQQLMVDRVAVGLVEKCARFHIYAAFCMADLGTKHFDQRMNLENLSKCLQTLRHLYDDLAQKSIYCDSESEFRAYDVLLNLADSNVLSLSHTYRKSVRNSLQFKMATKLACSFQANNYVSFFRLIREKATFLEACLCRSYFSSIRAKAIHTVVRVYRPTKFPTDKFTELLAFDDDNDTLAFLRELNLKVDGDGKLETTTGYQAFSEAPNGSKHGNKVIEDKLIKPLPEVIANGVISIPTFKPPSTSFISDYYGEHPHSIKRRH